jgi:3-dehydroquinate synthase
LRLTHFRIRSPISHVRFLSSIIHAHYRSHSLTNRKTRDGKQRFALPDGEFGKCVFANDVPISELQSVLATHKEFVKSRYGSGEGKEAYVDAGDLGVEPETYLNGKTNGHSKSNGHANGHSNGHTNGDLNKTADSLKNGDSKFEKAAIAAEDCGCN